MKRRTDGIEGRASHLDLTAVKETVHAASPVDEIMTTLGVTQREIACWLHVTATTVGNFRSGKTARLREPAGLQLYLLRDLASTMKEGLAPGRVPDLFRHSKVPDLGNATLLDALNRGEDVEFLTDVVRLGTGLSPRTERGRRLMQGNHIDCGEG